MICTVAGRVLVGRNDNYCKLGGTLLVRLTSHRDSPDFKSTRENSLSSLNDYLEEHRVPDLSGTIIIYLTLLIKTYSSKLLQCYRTC